MGRIGAIVVTYQPDLDLLLENLLACRAQVDSLLVVDNASDSETKQRIVDFARAANCQVLQLGDNLGVAAAQNRGIAWARKDNCSVVVLLDQDSKPEPDMVCALRRALSELTASGTPFAAVGPRLVDRRNGSSTPFLRIGMFGTTKVTCREGGGRGLIATDFLVSSGMMIPMGILDRVGLPEEGLFIDNVDLEWCFRARSKGLPVFGVCDAVMTHSIGDEVFKVGDYVIHRHKPLRQYYIMRNRILLYQRSYSPWRWVMQDFFRMIFKLLTFSVFLGPRRENICMMCRGIKDGLRGKLGKFN